MVHRRALGGLWLVLLLAATEARRLKLESYGGKAFKKNHGKANGQALVAALRDARRGDSIVIEEGKSYYLVPQAAVTLPARDLTLRIDGNIILSDAIAEWPVDPDTANGKYFPMLKVSRATGFTVEGSGTIDGQGHRWWWAFAVHLLPATKRPLIFDFEKCDGLTVKDVALLDSPRFNLYIHDSTNVLVSRVTILTDWRAQLATQQAVMLYKAGEDLEPAKWFMNYADVTSKLLEVPMFPFNTDGVDVSGKNIVVEDCVISNFDDVVAVKPASRAFSGGPPPQNLDDWTWCTSNMTVTNLTALYGGGASVGSVHPTNEFSCVNGATFKDIELWAPLKGPYVKPDHGICTNDDTCRCLVANIHYENVQLHQGKKPAWWNDYEAAVRSKVLFAKEDEDDDQDADTTRGGKLGLILAGQDQETETARRRRLLAYYDDDVVPPHVALTTGEPTLRGVLRYKREHRDDNGFDCRWWNYLCMIWPVWLGTQQQLEPDGSGSGIWPTTDPRAIVVNITLKNVTAAGGTWPEAAAAIRFNSTNPATGIELTDVVIEADKFFRSDKWICDDDASAIGKISGNIVPEASGCIQVQ